MAFVQQAEGSASGGAGTTAQSTAAFGAALSAGNALVWVYVYAAATAKTVTIAQAGQGATFTQVGSVFSGGSGMIWGYAKNITGGITAAVSSTASANVTFPGLAVAEYSALDTTAPFTTGEQNGQQQLTPGTGTDAVTSGVTPTLASQPAWVIGFSVDYVNNTAPIAGTLFNSHAAVWSFGGAGTAARFEDKRVLVTTAVAATFTVAALSEEHLTCVIVLKEPSGVADTTAQQQWNVSRKLVFVQDVCNQF